MTYTDIALLSVDPDFIARIAACYAVETLSKIGNVNYQTSETWSQLNAMSMAAQPGFGAAYAYALANKVEDPGKSTAVITDAQILGGVQSLLATQIASQPAEPAE